MDALVEYEYNTQSSVIITEYVGKTINNLLAELPPLGWELVKLNDVFPVGEREAFYLIIFRRPKSTLQFQT